MRLQLSALGARPMITQQQAPFTPARNTKSKVNKSTPTLAQRQGFTQGALEDLEREFRLCTEQLEQRQAKTTETRLKREINWLLQLAKYYVNCIRDTEWLNLTYQGKVEHAEKNVLGQFRTRDTQVTRQKVAQLLTYALLPFENEGERPTLLNTPQLGYVFDEKIRESDLVNFNPFDIFCHEVQRAHPDIPKRRRRMGESDPTS